MKKNSEIIKLSRRKCLIAALCFILFVIVALLVSIIRWEPKSDPESEKVIRLIASKQLNKGPNDLTDEDFVKMKHFTLWNADSNVSQRNRIKISDIRLLEKFTNLRELQINNLIYLESAIPKWIKILAKIGIYDLNERFALDLTPLEKLSNLQVLHLGGASIKNIKPLAGLMSLKQLVLIQTQVSDLEPIKSLYNLQKLYLISCPDITDQQIEDLQEILPDLEITKM